MRIFNPTAAVIVASLSFAGHCASQTIWYVNESASGSATGTSWLNAFTDLQDALAAAASGDQIWVAKGTYTPSASDATKSFVLIDGVALYGGFEGDETSLAQRDWMLNETILSGDIGRDDIVGTGQFWYLNWNRNTPNSGHVIVADGVGPGTIVDGFTIANGATGPAGTPAGDPLMYGGGIYCIGASPTIRNITFLHNLAAFAHGGAMYVFDGSPLIEQCRFLENYVHLGYGGGLYVGGMSQPAIQDCEFSRNVTIHGGSGGQGHGGGACLWSDLPITIERSLFDQNLAKHFFSVGGNWPARGAGLFNFISPITLIDCSFTRNQANEGGGVATFGPAELFNCLFTDNLAVPQPNDPWPELGGDGAGIASQSVPGATVTLVNCTIANNAAKKYAGVAASGNMLLDVRNSIFWGNTATDPDFAGFWESQLTKALGSLDYSCIQFIFGPPKLGEDPLEPKKRPGCIESDPHFVGAGNFALSPGSPCIDAARNANVPAWLVNDLAGGLRLVDDPATPDTGVGTPPIVDMGAFEFQVACYPDCDGSGTLDLFDFLCFVNEFNLGSQYADCDASGALDLFDFLCFVNEFNAACP